MALAQLLGASLNSEAKVFMTIRDFLAAADGIDDYTPSGPNPGPGWEIVDESYASGDPMNPTSNDWCVLRSFGEAEAYPVYIKLTFGATYHGISAYLAWDEGLQVGLVGVSQTENIRHLGAGEVLLYIHADLDEIHIVIKPRGVTDYFWSAHGRIKPNLLTYDGAALQVAGAVQAGSGVVIPLPSWPGWAVPGRKIYHWDATSIHELTITAADDAAQTITVETAYNKAAASWLAEDLFVFVFSGSTATLNGNSGFAGVPSRQSAGSSITCGNSALSMRYGYNDGKYGDRFSADIWLYNDNQNNPQCRGRLGLLRATAPLATGSGQAVAWQDEERQNWRLYRIYNVPSGSPQAALALREAV